MVRFAPGHYVLCFQGSWNQERQKKVWHPMDCRQIFAKATSIWHISLSRDAWEARRAWLRWNHRGFPVPCQKLKNLGGCTTLWITKSHWIVHFEVVNILCEFYLNKTNLKPNQTKRRPCPASVFVGIGLGFCYCLSSLSKGLVYWWWPWGVKEGTRHGSEPKAFLIFIHPSYWLPESSF